MNIFLFRRKSTKSIPNKPAVYTHDKLLAFSFSNLLFPSDRNKNGVEVALYCSTKKSIPNQMQTGKCLQSYN